MTAKTTAGINTPDPVLHPHLGFGDMAVHDCRRAGIVERPVEPDRKPMLVTMLSYIPKQRERPLGARIDAMKLLGQARMRHQKLPEVQ